MKNDKLKVQMRWNELKKTYATQEEHYLEDSACTKDKTIFAIVKQASWSRKYSTNNNRE